MNKNQSKSAHYGLTFLEALTLAFIVLKLTKVINWSWWWVLSPVWISPIAIIWLILIIACINYGNLNPKKKLK